MAKRIADAGHEIASHGTKFTTGSTRLNAESFRGRHLLTSKKMLEDPDRQNGWWAIALRRSASCRRTAWAIRCVSRGRASSMTRRFFSRCYNPFVWRAPPRRIGRSLVRGARRRQTRFWKSPPLDVGARRQEHRGGGGRVFQAPAALVQWRRGLAQAARQGAAGGVVFPSVGVRPGHAADGAVVHGERSVPTRGSSPRPRNSNGIMRRAGRGGRAFQDALPELRKMAAERAFLFVGVGSGKKWGMKRPWRNFL